MISFDHMKKMGQLLVLLLGLACLSAQATEVAATVLFSHGTVTVTNAAGGHDLNKGDGVAAGDTIHTGADGRIQMRFSDGGLVSLRPDSVFAVDKYNQPTQTSEGSLAFNLIKGGLRTLSGSIGHKDHANYQLKTSVATLGIRGTQFIVTMEGETMSVHVGQGQVSLYNDLGELILSAGQNGQVTLGQAPQLSLIVPQFGGNGDDDSQGSDGSDLISPDTLMQTLSPAFLLGEDADKFLQGGLALAAVSSDVNQASHTPVSATLTGFQLALIQQIAEDKGVDTAGWLSDVNIYDPAASVPNGTTVNVTNGLVWGEAAGSGGSNPAYTAYVLGSPATDLPQTGTLTYQLVDSTPVRDASGSQAYAGLDYFDLTINLNGAGLGQASYDVAMGMTGGGGVSGSGLTGSQTGVSSFTFSGGVTNGNCTCQLDVAGVLSGAGGSQAGVTYKLGGVYTTELTGGAVLTQQPLGGL